MNKNFLYKRITGIVFMLLVSLSSILISSSFSEQKYHAPKTASLKISFINTANGKPIVLKDSLYTNYFGEQYSISKLKYYISNIAFTSKDRESKPGGYYLMNAASDENSFEISLEEGNYSNLQFLLGVDSIRNCSGAQSGALDPMNDMFWTWSSGYVMFKMEGTSLASTADLNRIEHHVGGYKGTNNVVTKINLDLTTAHLTLKAGSKTELVIETNLDNYWHGSTDIKISELPVCVIMGAEAKKIALNFKNLFSIKSIHTNP